MNFRFSFGRPVSISTCTQDRTDRVITGMSNAYGRISGNYERQHEYSINIKRIMITTENDTRYSDTISRLMIPG